MNKISKKMLEKAVVYIILILGSVIMIFPFIWTVSTSFKNQYEVFNFPPKLIPEHPTIENYVQALTIVPIGRWFINSFIVASATTIFVIVVASLAGYVFGRKNFRGKDILLYMFLMTLMIPSMVTIIPNFLLIKNIGLMDTYLGLILPYTSWNLALSIYILKDFFSAIPQALEDAARIDGCSELQIFLKIMLPLAKPGIATIGIFTFLYGWDEFTWALTVTSSASMRTLPIGLALFHGEYLTMWTLLTAGLVIATIPPIVVFLLFQKYFIPNLMAGSVKM
ncbi:MAG: carbohydrate ABC transporter permease [Thermoproteales archaeon]|nr:carbohydrate ABC transporter permease [Thermoproteales archaeon]